MWMIFAKFAVIFKKLEADMELKCPHCGKSQSLSLQSLRASNGMVICPQCVSEFHIDLKSVPQQPEPEPILAEAIAVVVFLRKWLYSRCTPQKQACTGAFK